MLPEMAAMYVAGWVPSAGLTAMHIHLHKRKMSSSKMITLQKNLSSVGSVWIESEATIKEWTDGRAERDMWRYRRGALWLGAFSFVLSWVGFFFQFLIMASLRYLAVSRTEQLLFDSILVQRELSPERVLAELKRLKDQYPDAFRSVGTANLRTE